MHKLLFLHRDDKFPRSEDIDKLIWAEISNKEQYPELYEIVRAFIIHGPCGALNMDSPCMEDGKCSKHFPKRFHERNQCG